MRPSVLVAFAALFVTPLTANAQDADVEIPAGPSAPPAPAPAPSAPKAEPSKPEPPKPEPPKAVEKPDPPPAPVPAAGSTTEPAKASILESLLPPDVFLSAYAQAQYERHQDSQDELQQGGALLNQDRFLLRRGRVRLDAGWQYFALSLELDGNTTRGPAFGFRRAEATLLWRGDAPPPKTREERATRVPPIALAIGITDIPFGHELVESARDRVFTERSQASWALFPGEPDVGARLYGGYRFLRYSLALLNGEPLDDKDGRGGRDPNGAKDFVGRVGVAVEPTVKSRLSGGVSVLRGQGFHPGTDATKPQLQWKDANENSVVDPGEVSAVPGTSATPSATFSRFAFGADLRLALETPIGWTTLYGEVSLAQNLDRGLFVADPVATGIDTRELGAYAALVQEVARYGLVGFRFDYYDPNADLFDRRAGKLVPGSQAIKTLSPLVGLQVQGRARLVFQYDVVRDLLAKDARGVPVDLKNDRYTLRLQVSL